MNRNKLMKLVIEARLMAEKYNNGANEEKHTLKGFRKALETLGIAMNVYSVGGQISRIELAYGKYVEGCFLEREQQNHDDY